MKASNSLIWIRLLAAATLVMFFFNAIFFIFPVSQFVSWFAEKQPFTGKELIGAFGTLVATFFGALFAFAFAQRQRKKEKIENEISAGNRALFTLAEMWNALKQHQTEVVVPYRDREDAWFNLPTTGPMVVRRLSFDIKDLAFVLQADAPVLQQVILEEHRFLIACYLVDEHRSLILTEVFPRLSAAGLAIGSQIPALTIENILGAGNIKQLHVLTAGIIKNIDEDVVSCRLAFSNLRNCLKSLYPDRSFINLPE